MRQTAPLVVFSHLRWDFVFQRPQHLMVRLARRRPVVFVEEPVPDPDGAPRWELANPAPGVMVCRPRTPCADPGFTGGQIDALRPLVRGLLAERFPDAAAGFDAWFYSPLALPLVDGLPVGLVAYDNMDDLKAFRFAPPALRELEEELLGRAAVVFTGGPSLHQAVKDRHPNVHCFPSSVDEAHFAAARGTLPEPAGHAGVPAGPRLGYYGVIDERLDLDLIAALADRRPAYQFVYVGPTAKIDPADLPRRPNVHYAGMQGYDKLPAFLAHWDAALMPFALNDATAKISPTKVLEYFAAGKPVVSTPVADVVGQYGALVGIAADAGEFAAACDRALAQTDADRAELLRRYRAVLAETSWDATAAGIERRLAEARAAGGPAAPARTAGAALAARTPPVVVIGAGPTGLSAAYHLGEDALLVDANDRVGGWCRSVQDRGFTFDYAGHIMFSNDPYVHGLYKLLLGDNVHWQDREAWVYSKGVHTRYPFQGALYGLPADVIHECLMGAIEARYGAADPKSAAKPSDGKPVGDGKAGAGSSAGNGHANGKSHAEPVNRLKGAANGCSPDPKGDSVSDCCGDGVAESTLGNGAAGHGQPRTDAKPTAPANFEEFIYKVWGAGIAKHFAIPYNRKIWAVDLAQMETSWLGGRVPLPDLGEMIAGALSPVPKPMGPNARFGYPLRGGFQALMDGFLPHLAGPLWLGRQVVAVSAARRTVAFGDGQTVRFDQLVSTMPLPRLVAALGDEAPPAVREAAAGLRYTSVRCVNVGVGREKLTDKHWIYYPEETVFHRVFVQGNASPHCNPPGGFGLTCEITYGPDKPLPCDGDALTDRCVRELREVGLMTGADAVLTAHQVDMPFAYVVYDHARAGNVAVIRDWLGRHGVHLAGRYSEWEYYNSDHAFLAGKRAAGQVRAALRAAAPAAPATTVITAPAPTPSAVMAK